MNGAEIGITCQVGLNQCHVLVGNTTKFLGRFWKVSSKIISYISYLGRNSNLED